MGLQSSKLISANICTAVSAYYDSMQQLRAKGTAVSDGLEMQTKSRKQGNSMPASNTEKMALII